jgi:hypothetical protein
VVRRLTIVLLYAMAVAAIPLIAFTEDLPRAIGLLLMSVSACGRLGFWWADRGTERT